MHFLELAKQRHSVRKYTGQPVEPEKLDAIIEAAHVAPTAHNFQPVRLLVAQSKEDLEKLSRGTRTHLYGAPLAILVCADHSKAWVRPYDGKQTTDIDAAILTDHMMLAATELGLGTVWICHFRPEVLRREFALPEDLEPINLLAIGYSDQPPANPERHAGTRIPVSELVFNWDL